MELGSLIWPEAEAEANRYQKIINDIDFANPMIEDAANEENEAFLQRNRDLYYGSTALYGEYYDEYYYMAKEKWINSAILSCRGFQVLREDAKRVRSAAEDLYRMWSDRIGRRNAVQD